MFKLCLLLLQCITILLLDEKVWGIQLQLQAKINISDKFSCFKFLIIIKICSLNQGIVPALLFYGSEQYTPSIAPQASEHRGEHTWAEPFQGVSVLF